MIDSINITTTIKPKIEKCTIKPPSGIAGVTLFSIFCTEVKNENNMENSFEYYQKNKNDEASMGNIILINDNTVCKILSLPNLIVIHRSIIRSNKWTFDRHQIILFQWHNS